MMHGSLSLQVAKREEREKKDEKAAEPFFPSFGPVGGKECIVFAN